MTSQMNFGPEWMRVGEVSKRNFHLDDTSSKINNQQRNSSINDSNDDNSFKYSKEYMLSLYKSVDLPADIDHQEYAISTQGQSPLSLLEDKFLDNSTTMNRLNFKSDKGHTLENLNRKSNLLFNESDSFELSNNFRMGNELEDEPIWSGVDKDNVGTFDSNGVFHLGGGDSNLGDTSLESSLEPEEADDINFDFRNLNIPFSIPDEKNDYQMNSSNYGMQFGNNGRLMTTKIAPDESKISYQWVYRDPSGNVQGPFTSLEMQGWFEAGFFDNSLNIKREDAPFFEPLLALMQKVQNAKTPFLSPWPKEQSFHQRQQSNVDYERTQASLPKTTNNFASALLLDNGLRNHTLDQVQHMDNTLDTFDYNSDFEAKSSLNVPQSPFGNAPFVTTPLPRLNPTMNRTQLSSPWEYDNTQNESSSWLSNQNDPLYNGILLQQQHSSRHLQQQHDTLFYDGAEDEFGAGSFTTATRRDYQQQAMSQQMEQQYLSMLRQNQQQHIQLQQRMLQEQQQQLLLQQQQQRQQQEQLFITKQNYDQQRQQQRNGAPPPPALSLHRPFMNRGWTSVPNTPGFIEPLQSPWNASKFSNESFNHTFQPPSHSHSPSTNINKTESQEVHSKTLVEESNDQLTETLKNLSINETKPIFVEASESIEPSKQKMTSPSKQEESKKEESKQSGCASDMSAWGSTAAKKKTLREMQQKEEVSSSKKAPQVRSNTWSSVSAANKPIQQQQQQQQQQQRATPVISPLFSTSTRSHHQAKSNAWDTPVRQKRASMNASIPSTSKSSALPRTHASSSHPTIKSEPKGPSPEFLAWCKLSLRGLNAGVKVDEILQILLSFPIDDSYLEIIQDIIYANSSSMNGSRFASDFITRRKADLDGKLNIVLPKSSSANNNGSSEFKVVTKKGKKKQHH